MAFSFNTNSIPATGSACIFNLRTTLIAAGWTSEQDSDGSTYSNTGVQLTTGTSGAGGLANTDAWFVLRDPGGIRSFVWQRGTTNLVWRTKYSPSAGFIGGSPSATEVPSATDEVVLQGGGSDASPTFQTLFGTDGTLRFNCAAGDSTVGYAFYWIAFVSGLPSSTLYGMCMDVMATGSYPVSDTDPAIIYQVSNGNGGSVSGFGVDLFTNVTSTHAFMGATWQGISGLVYHDPGVGIYGFPAYTAGYGVTPNPFSSNDSGVSIPFGRVAGHSGPLGFKGFGSIMKWGGTNRANGDTISNTGVASKDTIWFNGCLLPWDGSSPVL